MIYLIGGAPRTGKTTLAMLILERKHIPHISTDILRNVLDYSPTALCFHEMPEEKQTEAFYPYLYKFLRVLQNKYPNFTVEGDIFAPFQVKELQEKIEIKSCFLGVSACTVEDLAKDSHANWVAKLPANEQAEVMERILASSIKFQTQSLEAGLPYIDTATDRIAALEAAYATLV